MKIFFLYLMIVLYVLAGINHFLHPKMYLKIVPVWIPAPLAFVYFTGILEIFFALLLIWPSTRIAGAWLIVALLIVIFPANIQMALDYRQQENPNFWIAILRLPLQIPLIWWAWLYTRLDI
jgi:uncharacterized membrane protein